VAVVAEIEDLRLPVAVAAGIEDLRVPVVVVAGIEDLRLPVVVAAGIWDLDDTSVSVAQVEASATIHTEADKAPRQTQVVAPTVLAEAYRLVAWYHPAVQRVAYTLFPLPVSAVAYPAPQPSRANRCAAGPGSPVDRSV
jgi:hypothetical protein